MTMNPCELCGVPVETYTADNNGNCPACVAAYEKDRLPELNALDLAGMREALRLAGNQKSYTDDVKGSEFIRMEGEAALYGVSTWSHGVRTVRVTKEENRGDVYLRAG